MSEGYQAAVLEAEQAMTALISHFSDEIPAFRIGGLSRGYRELIDMSDEVKDVQMRSEDRQVLEVLRGKS